MTGRLLFVTSGLSRGGAEGFLTRLVEGLAARGHACAVVSLGRNEPLATGLTAHGVEVDEVGTGWAGALMGLRRRARAFRPDVVQGWMYRGNLGANLAAAAVRPRPALAWSVRQGLGDLDVSPRGTKLMVAWNARWSDRPFAIVYNAFDAARQHEGAGFEAARTRIIPNGIDVSGFAHDLPARRRMRTALGLAEDAFVVGMLARWHPVKNHRGFVQAAGSFSRSHPEARFVLAGRGIDPGNLRLTAWLDEAGIRERCLLLGERGDIPELLAALDVATLASHAEALPNALLEGMAACVPCVAPAIGDIPDLIGDTGFLARADDPDSLAAGWESVAALSAADRRALGERARDRAEARYGIDRAVEAFAELYAEGRRSAVPA